MTESDTATLTRAIASGDTEAFARFYSQWFDPMFAMARRATGRDESFCLDVVQQAMMRVIRSIKPMNAESDVRRWLLAVIRTCALDALRSERRRRVRNLVAADRSQQRSEIDEQNLVDRIAWLRTELAALPADEARLLSMRFRFGWTLERIGQSLGLKPGAVDGRLARSIAALQSRAKEEFDDPRK